ncbi:MAG TPA: sensor histidine kinase [Clostridia bacterium]|nr:sensor histidine kinase [Clostridia bacterium]HPQ47301.1 sensor histidine kinase [Clostridia bacterium]HRX41456.1 sensor histidine kinase [Clostridia bacterium]
MSVNQIIPILIPGALIQLAIQIYYIKHCWENKTLSQRQKAWWIVAIAIFNLPASAIYLILTRNFATNRTHILDEEKTDRNIKEAISVLLYLLFMIFTITIIFNNYNKSDFSIIVLLLGVNLVLTFVSWFLSNSRFKYLHYTIPLLSLATAAYINYLDEYSTTTLVFLVIVANIINNHRTKASRIYSFIGFVLFIGFEAAGLYRGGAAVSTDEIVGFVYLNAAIYILVLMAFYLLKRQLLLNVRLNELIDETTEKSKALEEMAVIGERNKIAGEIHDTVGHTLTTAIISLDAALGDIGKDDQRVKEAVSLARQQIKKGMDDIRYSVRAIKHGADDCDFAGAFSTMLRELGKTSRIKVTEVMEITSDIIPIHRNLLFRVTKECITNSLKHGEATESDVLISESRGILNFTYSDNGKGTDTLEEGFGLQNIREMTKAMGGNVDYSSSSGEGFTMNLRLPLGREVAND